LPIGRIAIRTYEKSPHSVCIAANPATAAVSVRSTRAPIRIGIKPQCSAVSLSAWVKPPSAPISNTTLPCGLACVCSVAAPSGNRMNLLFVAARICCSHAMMSSGACIFGSRLRPHCSQAEMITCCQCSRRFTLRSADSLATLRVVASGWISATPSSVAFCTTQSIFSLLDKACACK